MRSLHCRFLKFMHVRLLVEAEFWTKEKSPTHQAFLRCCPKTSTAIHSYGMESRDFINVVDIAGGVIASLDNERTNGESHTPKPN